MEREGDRREESSEDVRGRTRPVARKRPVERTRTVTDVECVRVARTADGSIQDHETARPVRVTVTRVTVTETVDEDDELLAEDSGPGATAHLTYEFEDGTARVYRFENADPGGSSANWTGRDFRSVLPVADEAVANVPGVEEVTPARVLFGIRTDAGAEFDRGE